MSMDSNRSIFLSTSLIQPSSSCLIYFCGSKIYAKLHVMIARCRKHHNNFCSIMQKAICIRPQPYYRLCLILSVWILTQKQNQIVDTKERDPAARCLKLFINKHMFDFRKTKQHQKAERKANNYIN